MTVKDSNPLKTQNRRQEENAGATGNTTEGQHKLHNTPKKMVQPTANT